MRCFALVLAFALGLMSLACTSRDTAKAVKNRTPQWGCPGYSVLALVEDAPSVARAKAVRKDLAVRSELSECKDYYFVYVGVDLPDRFDHWFVLKVTKPGFPG